MRILLDTHVLVWALDEPRKLPSGMRRALEDPASEVLFSVASIWEIAIKYGLGREDFRFDPARVVDAAVETGFVELPVGREAAVRTASLPLLHRDPFDRLLIAQAMIEPALFFTADRQLQPYSDLVRLH